MPVWVANENFGYAGLEVPSAKEGSQKAYGEVADEDLLDPEDDDDALLPQHNQPSPWKSKQVRAFQAGDADEDKPEASYTLKPKKAKSKAAADPKQTTLTQPQEVKSTLSLPDPGTAVGSAARSKMLAAGFKKKEPSR